MSLIPSTWPVPNRFCNAPTMSLVNWRWCSRDAISWLDHFESLLRDIFMIFLSHQVKYENSDWIDVGDRCLKHFVLMTSFSLKPSDVTNITVAWNSVIDRLGMTMMKSLHDQSLDSFLTKIRHWQLNWKWALISFSYHRLWSKVYGP